MVLKIAILGTRGVPNHYGGFEHIAGYLSRALVEKGHEVTVYNSHRHPYQQKDWHGVRIIHCFDPEHYIGMAGQFIYDLNCILDARKQDYDIILMLGYTSSSIWGFLYPPKSVVITNMDGLEWRRTKYSLPVRRFLQYAERLAVRSSHYHVADSPIISKYLDNKYHIKSQYIAYGAEPFPYAGRHLLSAYGLKPSTYFLLMARMEPENNTEMILDGFGATASKMKFVIIGHTGNQLGQRLRFKYRNDARIIFLGAIFDEPAVQSLTTLCGLYFHGHSVGGTNPSLLDAMAARVPIAAHDNPFNRSILKNNALFFTDTPGVSRIITHPFICPTSITNNYTAIINEFTWAAITDQYENYFLECYQQNHAWRQPTKQKNMVYKEQY